MTELEQVPEPSDTGVKGVQTLDQSTQSISESPPLSELPLARRIEGLASTHARSMGGEVSAALIAGAMNQIAQDHGEIKNELSSCRGLIDTMRSQLSDCRERKAVIEERLRNERNNKHLRNLAITIGTALIGVAIELYSNDFIKESVIVFALGAILLVLGWLTGFGSDN